MANSHKIISIKVTLSLLMLLGTSTLFSQIPRVEPPRPAAFPNYSNSHHNNANVPSVPSVPNMQTHTFDAKKQNAALLEQVYANERLRKKQQLLQTVTSVEEFPFPDFSGQPGTEYFYEAYRQFSDMLEGDKEINLKQAVFLSENAWFDGQMSYEDFDHEIQKLKQICLFKLKEEGLSYTDNLAKIMTLFKVMTREVTYRQPSVETSVTHFPFKYDFNDYMGHQDLSQLFVSKLLVTGTGQCNSLPLLFLILAEELDIEAHLAFSPQHSYIKFSDDDGRHYNIELTGGGLVSDDYYMSSGFIKAEAIRNGIYMEPLDKKQTLAHIMGNLAHHYIGRHGYDPFVEKCVNTAMKYHPNNVRTHILNCNYHTWRAMYVISEVGAPPVEELPLYPLAYRLYENMHRQYAAIDSLGYEEMPQHIYQSWLREMEVEKSNPENRASPVRELKR